MKKLILCFALVSIFMVQANEKSNTEKISIDKDNGSCTVTVSYTDSYGDSVTATGTAETCSEAREKAYGSLVNTLKKLGSIE